MNPPNPPPTALNYLVVFLSGDNVIRLDPAETERLEAIYADFICGRITNRLVELTTIFGERLWLPLSDMEGFRMSTPAGRRKAAAQQAADAKEAKELSEEFDLNASGGEDWRP